MQRWPMGGSGESMAEFIGRVYPDAERQPNATRDDLPELAAALRQTGPIFLRGKDRRPAVYLAIPGPVGSSPRVRRQAFLSLMVRTADGRSLPADDATEARRLGCRPASGVPVPE